MSDPRTIPEALTDALTAALSPSRVSIRGEDRLTYARDMWPRSLLAVAAGVPPVDPPGVIVWPETTAEVSAVVRLCRAHGMPLVPYGAGSGVCGGAVATGGVVLDLKRMRRVLAIDEARGLVTFQPGILGDHLERKLGRRGFTLGHFPSSIMCSTAGGWVATRGAGQCSTKYGKIEDMVYGLEVVTGTGEVLTLRCGEGPDVVQLIVGSEGTLGIITAATCVMRPVPQARRMRGWSFPNVESACAAMRSVLQRGMRPAVVRLYDELDTLISGAGKDRGRAVSDRPEDAAMAVVSPGPRSAEGEGLERESLSLDDFLDMLRPDVHRAGKGLTRWLVSRALRRPGMLNRLADRLVPRLSGGCLLILGFEGDADLTYAEERAAAEVVMREGGRDLGAEPGDHWLRHRYDVSFKMPKAFAAGAFVDTMEVASTWERLLPLYHAVREAVAPHAFVMAHFSHAYVDGCSIYFTFAGRRRAAAGVDQTNLGPAVLGEDEARYDAMWSAALHAVVRAGGTISHHHGIGRLKAPFMAAEHGAGMGIYEALKRTLDPDGVLNPGKMGLGLQGAA